MARTRSTDRVEHCHTSLAILSISREATQEPKASFPSKAIPFNIEKID